MDRDCFWLTDAQFARIAPHLPADTRGKARVDDRRVISGIVHVLKSGGRWVDAPDVYGPRKTLYNRFVRWAAKGVWIKLFQALAQAGGPPAHVLMDSSAVKAHRSAAGGKGGSRAKPSGARAGAAAPRSTRLPTGGAALGAPAHLPRAARRQGVRHGRATPASGGERNRAQHPAQGQSGLEAVLLARALPGAQRD